ncbi:MAG: hypothetical protein MUE98_08365 [Rhodobacteraceae bacterium]|jgi:hypothetical protein|nr:hypothetical protein [Paracoccaceae bacterium]
MTKHAADKPHTPQRGGRLKRYTEIEREEGGPRPQTTELQKRPRERSDDGRRAAEYVRIDKGRRA